MGNIPARPGSLEGKLQSKGFKNQTNLNELGRESGSLMLMDEYCRTVGWFWFKPLHCQLREKWRLVWERVPTSGQQAAPLKAENAMGNDRNIRNPVTAGHLAGGWSQQYSVVPSTVGEGLASRGPPNITQNSGCMGYGEPPLQAGSHGSPQQRRGLGSHRQRDAASKPSEYRNLASRRQCLVRVRGTAGLLRLGVPSQQARHKTPLIETMRYTADGGQDRKYKWSYWLPAVDKTACG
ncbi:hypothetical protein C8R45DRAFT_932268 [Mycena sanguinolenta]|nr:hypothetical protein C8R45DRAFT_932268 [Mycena sanguinolenta]